MDLEVAEVAAVHIRIFLDEEIKDELCSLHVKAQSVKWNLQNGCSFICFPKEISFFQQIISWFHVELQGCKMSFWSHNVWYANISHAESSHI